MKKSKATPSLLTQAQAHYHQYLKKLKKKQVHIKVKLAFTVLLPVVITLIASKVIKTFVHIKIRDLFTHDTKESPSLPKAPLQPEPAHTEPVAKTIITPEPIQK